MTDSNRTQMTYVEETTWGTTPASPQMQALRITSESFTHNIQNIVSEEIREDRQVTDLIQVAQEGSGDVNFELSYGTYDDFFKAVLMAADWQGTMDISSTTIDSDATGHNITGENFNTLGVKTGQWVKVGGFTDPLNNGYKQVTAVGNTKIAVSPVPNSAEAAGATITIESSCLRNGSTETSFTVEKGMVGASEYFLHAGVMLGQLALNFEVQKIVTGSFGVMGKSSTLSGTSIDSTPTDANSNEVFNPIGNIGSIREGEVEVTSPNYIKQLSMELSNNLRTQFAIGSDSAIGVGIGKCDIIGKMVTYFGNSTLYDKFLAGTATSIDWRITDAEGNTYIFDLPHVKFDDGKVLAGGQDQDVMADMSYRALKDPTYNYTFQITKFDA